MGTTQEIKEAVVWVGLGRHKKECPYASLFHELSHVLIRDAGIENDIKDTPVHCLVDRIGIVAAEAYLKD